MGDWWFAAGLTFVYALWLFLRLGDHAPWRDEWQAWMLADAGSPWEVVGRVRNEGHPPLWHLMLWAVGRVWDDVVVMKLLHGVLACGVVWVVARYAPFTRVQKVLLAGGYFFAFEYAQLSRGYVVGVLAVICFAAAMRGRSDECRVMSDECRTDPLPPPPLAYASGSPPTLITHHSSLITSGGPPWMLLGFLAGVSALSNPIGALTAPALGLVCLAAWLAGGRGGRRDAKAFAAGAAVFAVMLGLAVWAMWAPHVVQYTPRMHGEPVVQRWHGFWVLSAVFGAIVPIPGTAEHWHEGNVFNWGRPARLQPWIGAVLLAGVTLVVGWDAWKRNAARVGLVLWVTAAGAIVTFMSVRFLGSARHHGFLVIFALAAWWIASPAGAWTRADRARSAAVTVFLLIGFAGGMRATWYAWRTPFSASAEVARWVEAYAPDAVILGDTDFATSSVAGALGRPIHNPACTHPPTHPPTPASTLGGFTTREKTFIVWDGDRRPRRSAGELAALAGSISVEGRPTLVLLSFGTVALSDPELEAHFGPPVAVFDRAIVADERYEVRMLPTPRP